MVVTLLASLNGGIGTKERFFINNGIHFLNDASVF
jgi:hypothetical protein